MIALGIQSIVVYRQRHRRIRRGEPDEMKKYVFVGYSMRDFDKSFVNALKFLVDFGFFKFGLECTMVGLYQSVKSIPLLRS